jgi:uncharacterized membrane protein YqhA
MEKLLERSVLIVMIAVVRSLFASAAAFLWGAVKTATVVIHFATGVGKRSSTGIELIALMDTFLISTALFIFSLGMYELFIHGVTLPAWLVVHNLHDLKAKLISVIILVMGVTFLESPRAEGSPGHPLFQPCRCRGLSRAHSVQPLR